MNKRAKKITVILREKPLKDGRRSLYLDIYNNGKRHYEFLHRYLEADTRQNKAKNTNTLNEAKRIEAERYIELMSIKEGRNRHYHEEADFLAYMINRATRADRSTPVTAGGTLHITRSVIRKIKEYAKTDSITFRDVDKNFIIKFIDYLTKPPKGVRKLKPSTIKVYYSAIVAVFNSAVKEGIIGVNPIQSIPTHSKPKGERATREYLEVDEVKRLFDTPYPKYPLVRTAFLFGCTTGLRISDILTIRCKNLTFYNDGSVRLRFKQVKTGTEVDNYLSADAISLLPTDEGLLPDDFVFGTMDMAVSIRYHLPLWLKEAGISKKISFHCSRHTFATMSLTCGIDLYTVSKSLGHSHIGTTQIYAEITDTKKKEAVAKLPKLSE